MSRREKIKREIDARNVLSSEQHERDKKMFLFDLQLFGKSGGKMVGKVLMTLVGAAFGFFNPTIFFGAGATVAANGIAAGIMGAALGGTIWTAISASKEIDGIGDNNTPSIQRFDKAQEGMSSTASIPIVYGTRKIAGNQTYHQTSADQNTLHKHVVLCEGGIGGIESVSANGLLIPLNGQTSGTVFTISNVRYEDAKVWKDGKTLHLFCNGHDREIYLCNKDDAENVDTFFEWQTNIATLVSYINRLNDGWQAFPVATTTKYPGDLRMGGGQSAKVGSGTISYNDLVSFITGNPKAMDSYNRLMTRGYGKFLQAGDRIDGDVDGTYYIITKVEYPTPAPVTVENEGRTYTYTPQVDDNTPPTTYYFDSYGFSYSNGCYNSPVDLISDTIVGGTSYTFHDCEPPSNYEEVGGYPNMAWLDMTFTASQELGGGNPSVDCVVRGKKVYDPRTGRMDYSENPALIVWDFLCSKRYGLGRWISADDLDIDSFVQAANYCDEEITMYDAYENPIKGKRYTLNMVIDQRQDAIKWLQEMLGNFAGWLVISKNKIKLLVEQPSPICYKFDDDNINNVKIVPLKASDTPNQYVVSLCDPLTNWRTVSVITDNFADQKARGKVVSKSVELSGVTSQPQALRLARYYSDYNLSCPMTISFKTGIQAMALECGDVVTVSYRDAFTEMPIRISMIRETGENEFEISGRQYNESIYSDDLGGGIQTTNYANHHGLTEESDYFVIDNVEHLKAETQVRRNLDGKTVYDISVTYQLPANYYIDTARVYYKINATGVDSNQLVFAEGVPADELGYKSDWKFAGENVSQVTIPNVRVGDIYKIRVVSKTRKGNLGDIDQSPEVLCKVTAKSTVPAKPYNLRYDFRKEFRFMWEDVPDSDVVYYEIRLDDNVGMTTGLLGRSSAPTAAVHLTERQGTVYVYAINAQKEASEPATCEYIYPKPDAPAFLEFYPTPRGMRIIVPPFPESVLSMNLYITSTKVSEKISSENSAYVYMGEPDIYTLRVTYVDLIGEGYMSQEYEFVIEPSFPEEWIQDGALSIAKMDKEITKAVERAQKIDSDITALEKKDGEILATVSKVKKDADGQISGIASQISQHSDKITSIITELNQTDPSKCKYSAIAQLLDGINLRVKKGDVINQINMTSEGTTIDGKYLHVTGTTKFDKDVITEGMIKAGSITAEKMASQMITLRSRNGLKGFTGGQVRLDHKGMTVNKNDGSAVLFNGNGMSFRNRNGGVFSALGAFMVGVAHDGQYVRFNNRWDKVPSVLVMPLSLQTSVAGFTDVNIYQQVGASEISPDGFRVNCKTVLGNGSGGAIPYNKRVWSGNTYNGNNKMYGGMGAVWYEEIWICDSSSPIKYCKDMYGNGQLVTPDAYVHRAFPYCIPDNKYFYIRNYVIEDIPADATHAEITMSAYIGESTGLYGIHAMMVDEMGHEYFGGKIFEILKQKGTDTIGTPSPKIAPYGAETDTNFTFSIDFAKGTKLVLRTALYCYSWRAPSSTEFWVSIDSIKYNTNADTVVSTGDAMFLVLDQNNKLYSVR